VQGKVPTTYKVMSGQGHNSSTALYRREVIKSVVTCSHINDRSVIKFRYVDMSDGG